MGYCRVAWGLPEKSGDNPGDSEIALDLGKRVRECVPQANDNGASGSRHYPAGCGGSIEAREGTSRKKQAYGRWTRYSERIECFDVRSDRNDERPSGREADRERQKRAAFGSGVTGAPHRTDPSGDGRDGRGTRRTGSLRAEREPREAADRGSLRAEPGAGAKHRQRIFGEADGAEPLDRTGWPRNHRPASAGRRVRGLRAFWRR